MATIVTPLIVLTLNVTKSRVVGDIVGVPVALVALLAVLRIGGGAIPWTGKRGLSPAHV